MRFFIVCSILLFIVWFSPNLSAYPGNASTLKERVAKANNIVLAYVISTRDNGLKYPNDHDISELCIIQVLKGSIKQKTISVVTFSYTCPEPASFDEGNVVITFLDKIPRQPLYYIPWDKGGIREASHHGIDAYVKRIREMQQILKIKDITQQSKATFDWALRCLEHPDTAWEAQLMLIPDSVTIQYEEGIFEQSFGKTPEQLQRVRKAVLAMPRIPHLCIDLVGFVGFSGQKNDPQITHYLLKQLTILKAADFKDYFFYWEHLNHLLFAITFFADKQKSLVPIIRKIQRRHYRHQRLVQKFIEKAKENG